jgi:NAD-dependent deacetylase
VASLQLRRYNQIVFLTGAGISRASGLPTYRGPGGLWTDADLARLADASSLVDDIAGVWRMFGGMRKLADAAKPNAGHLAIARLDPLRTPAREITIITQNVDGLHQRAGSTNVIELHGTLFRTRCMDRTCPALPREDHAIHDSGVPRCATCGADERPDVVFFNELIPAEPDYQTRRALRECDLFIAVGTSGTVSPAANFVRSAAYAGARTILVNLERMAPVNPAFGEEYIGPAEELLPQLLGDVTGEAG